MNFRSGELFVHGDTGILGDYCKLIIFKESGDRSQKSGDRRQERGDRREKRQKSKIKNGIQESEVRSIRFFHSDS